MSSFEYYSTITQGLYYDDEGNALCEENPEGKWDKYNIGKNFSYPFKLNDGKESYQAFVKDIDWDSMVEPTKLYEFAWECAMEGREPQDEIEKKIYESMKDKTTYFSNFKDKDDYVTYSTSYWNYAFVDENGWIDVDSARSETEWIKNFYKKFVQHLEPNDLVTIYECSVNND